FQMLEKCAEAAALRRAFPESCNEPVAEEMEGRLIQSGGAAMPTTDKPPVAADFPNSQGVPQDGVTQVEDDEDEDDGVIVEDPPAANVPAQATAAEPSPEAQASPPAADPVQASDPRPEPPPADG